MAVSRSTPKVTRADVARLAGVSTAVVSYVVNEGPRPVSPDTRERVRQAIRTLGYRPNPNAQALRTGSTKLLGLIVPELENTHWAEQANAITSVAESRGLNVIVASSNNQASNELRHIRSLSARRVDGLIIASTGAALDLSPAIGVGIPVVFINTFQDFPDLTAIGVDACEGARLATAHLLEHGYGAPGLIVGRGGGLDVEPREAGWSRALQDAGEFDGPVVRTSFSRQGGYEAGLRLFSGSHRPRSIFVSSDMQALGLLKALHEVRLKVPDDVAIVSFDGTIDSLYTNPPLTVVHQPVEEMARAAVNHLLDDDGTETSRVVIPALLVIRESCGCTPAPA